MEVLDRGPQKQPPAPAAPGRPRGTAARLAIVAVAALLAPSALPAAPPEPSPDAVAALSLLHHGSFAAAADAFGTISRKNPTDPEGPVYEALTTWWRLLDDPKDRRKLGTLAAQLEEAIKRGRALIESGDAQRGRLLAGTALLLQAQTRAAAKNYFSAGSAARDGHRLLSDALEADPTAADAWFALGAYKYYAAKLPWLVRALRIFVFIPGGDAEEGLRGLRTAADKGRFFGVEARLLLAYVASGDDEDDMSGALEQLRIVRSTEPDSPLLSVVEARFFFALGRLAESEKTARETIALAGENHSVAKEIVSAARLRLGLALYYQYRPQEALEAIAPLLAPDAPMTADSEKTLESLRARLRADLGDAALAGAAGSPPGNAAASMIAAAPLPSDASAVEALEKQRCGDGAAAIDALSAALSRQPDDSITRYHLARAYQIEGRAGDAESELRRLLTPGVKLPKVLHGWALIRLGAALESEGKRAEAEPYYRLSADLDGFIFRRAAKERLRHPSATDPLPEG